MSIDKTLWHSLSIEKTLAKLKTTPQGLTKQQAKQRLRNFGLNEIPKEKGLSTIAIFFSQFKNPLIYILLIAVGVTFLLREFADMGVILGAVTVNTIIGFFQENKANKSLSKLRKMVEHRTTVIRDDSTYEIKTQDLVPGDIIALNAGDKIPADARLIEVNDLKLIEASLTGESIPSTKSIKKVAEGTNLADRESMIYLGTVVARGRGKAVVCETGQHTELGQIAKMIKETPEEKTPLQKQLGRFSLILGLIIVGMCLLILFEGLLRDKEFFEMFLVAVAIAVAAIPEGLLVAVTVILTIGMQRVLHKKALIRRLISAETLGSTTVICSDKTGTLTVGMQRVAYILSGLEKLGQKFQDRSEANKVQGGHLRVLTIGSLCNDAVIENPSEDLKQWRIIGDPTEKALLLAGAQAGLSKKELEKKQCRLAEIPFDGQYKFMATLNRYNENNNIIYLKGAPENILSMTEYVEENGERCKLTPAKKKELKLHYEELTRRGLRVLAVGCKTTSRQVKTLDLTKFVDEKNNIIFQGITFVGVVGLRDPLRPEAKETIKLCQRAGIRPIIITGDHKFTAKAIANEVGLEVNKENILEGSEIDKLKDSEFNKLVKKINLYARVEPKHKLRIIDALQAQGEVVAMTGDGINDAPALKSADIGIALGSGTDVAKETSDLIILDNNFKTIVVAIRQGRIIFDNIRKVILYLLSDSFTEIILIGVSLLFGWPLPILAAQILWVNLIEDGLPNFALAFEHGDKEVMNEPPRKTHGPILNKEMKILIFLIGVITDLILLGLFFFLWKIMNYELVHVRTFIFVGLGIDSLFYIFSCRSLRHSIWHQNPFSNKFLTISVLIGFVLLIGAVYLPPLQSLLRTVHLSFNDWLLLIGIGLFNVLLIELTKWVFIVRQHRKKIIIGD